MMMRMTTAAATLLLMACNQTPDAQKKPVADTTATNAADPAPVTPVEADDNRPFSRITPEEVVHFTGTEPFWGGQVSFTRLTYSTPEDPEGTTIEVDRFAGRGGVSWSGTYHDAPFSLAVTPGECSDGMSDRKYPYGATLQVSGEQRTGCAWTEDEPFTAPPGYEG
jgi:uncharacterized membrane protein